MYGSCFWVSLVMARLSWIEFIFDRSMWASILVYIFEVITEAMMMMLHTFMLWYDTLYDDNDVHSMNLMHSYTIWCACILECDDALLCIMMYTWCWWCILPVDDMILLWYDEGWWCLEPYDDVAYHDDDDAHSLVLMNSFHVHRMMNREAWPAMQTWHGWWADEQVLMSSIDEHQWWGDEQMLMRRLTERDEHRLTKIDRCTKVRD